MDIKDTFRVVWSFKGFKNPWVRYFETEEKAEEFVQELSEKRNIERVLLRKEPKTSY